MFVSKVDLIVHLNLNEIKIIGFINNTILVSLCMNNKQSLLNLKLNDELNNYIMFEIMSNSPIWSYKIVKIDNYKYVLEFHIDENLIDNYLTSSFALLLLLKKQFTNLKQFNKFDGNISYYPGLQMYDQSSEFKINLYDYQKKSLYKMIDIEKNGIHSQIEYTYNINLGNSINVLYDPIKSCITQEKKYFKLITKGGVLADEMGLGKTITSIALITSNPCTNNNYTINSEKFNVNKIVSKATMIICPSHLLKQWENEIIKCNPTLKIIVISTKRDHEKLLFQDFIDSDIIITSYQFLMNFKYYPCLYYKYTTPASFHNKDRLKNIYIHYSEKIVTNKLVTNKLDEETFKAIKLHETPLFEFFWFHRLIIDEGHEIFGEMLTNKSMSKYISEWLNNIDANNFWLVSGSPFINYIGVTNSMKFIKLQIVENTTNMLLLSNTPENILFQYILNKEYLWENIFQKICIRHCKNDINNEINIFGYNETTEWITFTELEIQLYASKKNKLNSIGLQQLCCHPLIVDSCKRLFGNIDIDLSDMQSKMIEHHTHNLNVYTDKLNALKPGNQSYYMIKKSYENIINESKYMLSIMNKLTNNIEENNEDCSICLSSVENRSITKCGHIYCTDCIKTCLKYKQICPMCKKPLKNDEIYIINKSSEIKVNNDNPLVDKYGSKLGRIIIFIRNIVLDPESRIIIFSQWDHMLLLIGKSLSENGIANCFVKGNTWARNNAISKFKNGKTISGEANKVIMLSLKNAASGTNLTEATHIIFVEPINSSKEEVTAIESQAIGRACRIGQKQKVNIHRFLVKNTIEEEIYNAIYK